MLFFLFLKPFSLPVSQRCDFFWVFEFLSPGVKPLLHRSMNKIMKANPALYVLRERIRTLDTGAHPDQD